jgi:aerobic-type carbon monoxide dehydrogenase small subunit (CoxS/CutS family)
MRAGLASIVIATHGFFSTRRESTVIEVAGEESPARRTFFAAHAAQSGHCTKGSTWFLRSGRRCWS